MIYTTLGHSLPLLLRRPALLLLRRKHVPHWTHGPALHGPILHWWCVGSARKIHVARATAGRRRRPPAHAMKRRRLHLLHGHVLRRILLLLRRIRKPLRRLRLRRSLLLHLKRVWWRWRAALSRSTLPLSLPAKSGALGGHVTDLLTPIALAIAVLHALLSHARAAHAARAGRLGIGGAVGGLVTGLRTLVANDVSERQRTARTGKTHKGAR